MSSRSPAHRVVAIVVAVVLGVGFGVGFGPVGVGAAAGARADAAGTTTETAAGDWLWPVPAPHRVTRPFHVTVDYEAGHRGIDLEAADGTPVTAPADGVVHFAGTVVDRPVLSLRHEDGSISSFEPVETELAAGTGVAAGAVVGRLSTPIRHDPAGGLHVGLRIDGAYRNPLERLGGVPAAVLLPLAPLRQERRDQARGWAMRYASRSRSELTCV